MATPSLTPLPLPTFTARVLLGALLLFTAPAFALDCDLRLAPGADLQQAIDQLPADDRAMTICLKAGDYPLRQMISIQRDRVTLRGAGRRTVLTMADGIAQPAIVIGDYRNQQPQREIREVRIEQLAIVGAAAPHEFMPELPYLSNSAVVIRRGRQITLRELELRNCRSACILSEFDSRELLIERNHVSAAVWDGVSFNRSAQVRLIGNTIRGNVAAGITTEHLEDSEIRDNRIEANGSHGVYLSDSLRNRFENNRFSGNRHAGIFLTCAVRYRDPAPVLCWDNSMSQDNRFERNRFEQNQYSYAVGADSAANCLLPEWRPNLWRDNRSDSASLDPQPDRYGLCMRP